MSGAVTCSVDSGLGFGSPAERWAGLVEFVERTRSSLTGRLPDEGSLRELVRGLQERVAISDPQERALIEALVADLEAHLLGPGSRFDRVKALINQLNLPVIVSVFDAAYFKGLDFDVLVYDRIHVNGAMVRKYSTNVVPINLVRASSGFHLPHVVALFPENHLDHNQLVGDQIFYIIDKFVKRFNRTTRPLLSIGVVPHTFERLRGISDDEVQRCAAYWVWLHEYFHRQGPLPLPEFLDVKSYRPLAGLEECRVDMHALLVLLNDDDLPYAERMQAAEFIFAERLLRYAIEGLDSPNYDAIGSQILFNFLRQEGALCVVGERIQITERLEEGIHAFVREIERIEVQIDTWPRQQVKQALVDFTKRYTNYDHRTQQYRHEPMFAHMAHQIREGLVEA